MGKRHRKSLANRYQSTYDNNEGIRRGAFDFPSGTKFYSIKEDGVKHAIIIIPYIIKTDKHPLIATNPKTEIGDLDYLMDIWVHQFVGPEKCDIICLSKNYGKPCPLCEEADKFRKAGKKEEASNMNASRRSYYNIIDANKPGEGLQVLHHSHSLFQKGLIREAQAEAKKGKSFVDFAGYEDGKVISFRADKEKKHGMTFFECNSIRFRERKEYDIDELKDEWIDNTISFDEIMEVLTYEQICERLFLNQGNNAEEPEKEEKQKQGEVECPHGMRFGIDWEIKKVCDDCELWGKCEKAYDENKKANE